MKDTNLIIGKINSGKTKGILFKETKKLIESNENLFVLDERGEYFKTFGEELEKNGYNVRVINFKEPLKSDGWNPLELPYEYYKNGEIDKCLDCLNDLTLEIFKTDNINADPFWTNTSADYVKGLILILFKEAKEYEIKMRSIGTLLTRCQEKYNDTTLLKEYLKDVEITDPIYTYISPTEFAPSDTKGSILSVIRQKLNLIFMRENLLDMLSFNDLYLTQSDFKEKTAIIVIGKNEMANVLLDQLVYRISEEKVKFNFILENIENYSNILSLKDLVENSTYRNLKLFVSTRDLEELEYKYGKYLFNKFQNIINVEGKLELIPEGNYENYPEIKEMARLYFDFEEFMKNR